MIAVWGDGRRAAPDRVLALGLLVLNLVEMVLGRIPLAELLGAVPSVLLLTVPLVWRRAAPLLVLTLVVAGYTGQVVAVGYFDSVAMLLAWMVAVYTVASWAPVRHCVAGAPITLIPVWVFLWAKGRDVIDVAPSELLLAVVPAVAGLAVRRSRERAQAAERLVAERDRAARAEAALAAAQERARVARELHDVIAHSVSVIVVQAEAAEATLERDLERSRMSLQAIQQTGRDALYELRQMLGLLRTTDTSRELAPEPSLAQLPALVEQVRAAGVDVTDVRLAGDPATLPAGVQLCAYRVVQEGLTNAVKHARGGQVRIALEHADDVLSVEVVSSGGRSTAERSGFGLLGIRERVLPYDGEVHTEALPGGGFALRVRLHLCAAR